jgi:hypothetical protein
MIPLSWLIFSKSSPLKKIEYKKYEGLQLFGYNWFIFLLQPVTRKYGNP